MQKSLLIVATGFLLLAFQNCAQTVHFDDVSSSGETETSLSSILTEFKPALAVRGVSCTMCHAKINGTTISDMGYSDGTDNFHLNDNYGSNWDPQFIQGDILVPQNLPSDRVAQLSRITHFGNLIKKSRLYIGAPSPEDIRRAAKLDSSSQIKWINSSGSGLSPSGAAGVFVNSGTLNCDGDVAVSGIVHLKNVQVKTQKGCRITATGSIFITGGISFVNGSADANLQLISSTAVLFGFSQRTLQERESRTGAVRSSQVTPGHLVTEANRVSGLVDADDSNLKVHFERILANAPYVQSRYNGAFKGTIIAEIALMRLGEFEFSFDPVFTRVPVIPLTGAARSLSVTD